MCIGRAIAVSKHRKGMYIHVHVYVSHVEDVYRSQCQIPLTFAFAGITGSRTSHIVP